MVESRCGILCSKCEYREKMGCQGCVAIHKPFWGDSCPVKDCCESRGHDHCGHCSNFPCKLLNDFAYDKEQGDNGKRIEVCRSWKSYDGHGINICSLTADEVETALSENKTLTLATCACNRVTIRPMSHVNDGLTVYFQTGENYLKTLQIKENSNVALCVGTYEIEGTAKIIGHPLNETNALFIQKLKEKHNNAFERWSSLPNQVVIKVEIGLVRQWRYVSGKPVVAIGKFGKSESIGIFDAQKFISDVASQNASALKGYFAPNAIVCWHDSNEKLTVDEYIRANCEYPGEWNGEVQRIEKTDVGIITVTKMASADEVHLITAFIKLTEGKITHMDEYYSECGEAPEWRKQMNIGKPITTN